MGGGGGEERREGEGFGGQGGAFAKSSEIDAMASVHRIQAACRRVSPRLFFLSMLDGRLDDGDGVATASAAPRLPFTFLPPFPLRRPLAGAAAARVARRLAGAAGMAGDPNVRRFLSGAVSWRS